MGTIPQNNKHTTRSIICVGIVITIILILITQASSVFAGNYIYTNPTGNSIVDTNHCLNSDNHIHPAGGGAPICSGTISYIVNNLYEGASLFGVLLQTMVGIVVTGAFFYFFWNLVKYIRDEEGKEEAKTKMGYSLGAIFVIVTLWGIIGFVRGVLGVGAGESVSGIDLPTVNWGIDDNTTYEYIITQQDIDTIKTNGGNISRLVPTSKGVTTKPCHQSNGDRGITYCRDTKKCCYKERNCSCTEGGAALYTGS